MGFEVSIGDKFRTNSGVATVINTTSDSNKVLVELVLTNGECLMTRLIKLSDGTYENLQNGLQAWPEGSNNE